MYLLTFFVCCTHTHLHLLTNAPAQIVQRDRLQVVAASQAASCNLLRHQALQQSQPVWLQL